jgi:hypothetical protein
LQTFESARKGIGFYSANEFMLNQLGKKVLKKSIELGRACIDKEHRNGRILFLLWKELPNTYNIPVKDIFLAVVLSPVRTLLKVARIWTIWKETDMCIQNFL